MKLRAARLRIKKKSRNESTEGQIHLDPRYVCLIDAGRFAQIAFSFGALGRKQMTAGGMPAQNLSRAGDLESLRDGLASFTAGNRLWHKSRKIGANSCFSTAFRYELRSSQQTPRIHFLSRNIVTDGTRATGSP